VIGIRHATKIAAVPRKPRAEFLKELRVIIMASLWEEGLNFGGSSYFAGSHVTIFRSTTTTEKGIAK